MSPNPPSHNVKLPGVRTPSAPTSCFKIIPRNPPEIPSWLQRVGEVAAAPVPHVQRESPTTAFWRVALPRRARRPRPLASVAAAPESLVDVGHLVDEVMANFSDPSTWQRVLHCLLSLGRWTVRLCRAEQHQTPFSRSIYLMVAPPGQSSEYIVDFTFAEKFHTARPTRQLTALLGTLPPAFVGTADVLSEAILICSGAVEESFTQLGLVIPPWRAGQQMQQLYFSCRAPECCGLCRLRRCSTTSLHRGLSRIGTLDNPLSSQFVQFLSQAIGIAPLVRPSESAVPRLIDADTIATALQALQSPAQRCPLCCEDSKEDFPKVVPPEDTTSAHSDLAKLLTATWYMRAPVRQGRCPAN